MAACSGATSEDEEFDAVPSANEASSSTAKKKKAPKFVADFSDAGTVEKEEAPPTPAQCLDKDDPGPSENVARALPDTDDCDDAIKEVSGILSSAIDVDVYKLTTKDKLGCNIETTFEISTPSAELCVYPRCRDASFDPVKRCIEGDLKKNDLGMYGCCSGDSGKALPDWDCQDRFDDDSADIYFRVKARGENKCQGYKIRYRF